MASRAIYRSVISSFSRCYSASSSGATASYFTYSNPSFLLRVRPLAAVSHTIHGVFPVYGSYRALSTRQTQSSLNDSSPNFSNRPPKETILLDGCDFEHWLVVLEKPDDNLTRDEIIDMYIETLAQIVGSKDEARMKIYSVSTKHYFAFGALVSEEMSYKLKELSNVRWVLPDSYLDVRNKDYGGEPFINGQAVPYDPKYHEEWVRNNAKAMERNRRNDRPRNFDRSRNFERRRQNMQTQGPPMSNHMQNPPPPNNMGGPVPPPNNMGGPVPPPHNMGGPMQPPHNMRGPMPPPNNMGGQMTHQSSNMGGQMPPHQGNVGGQMPPPQGNMGGQMPPHQGNMGGHQMPPYQGNMGGQQMPPYQGNMGGGMPFNQGGPDPMRGGMPPNMGGMPPNMGGVAPGNMGRVNSNSGWEGHGGNGPNYQTGVNHPQHQSGPGQSYQQGNYDAGSNRGMVGGSHGENPYQQGQRDIPPSPPPNYRQ